MKEKETKSVKKQNSIFEYGKKHGFSFSWDRSVIEKIIFLALYFGTILIVHLVFKIQSITEIYMILLVTIPFAVYSYCKVVDGGKFDIKEVLNSCIRIGFVFSTVSLLLFVDLYYEFVNTSVVIVDLVVLILCFAYLGITKERKITLKLLLLPLLIFVVFIASVNVIRASTLVNEVIIILIVITLLYFLRMVTRRYFVVWNVCYFVTLIAFVLCLPFMFSNNHDESVFERSNYLDFEDTVFPSDFNQIIELNGFTYLLSEDKVSVYLDDDFKKEYLFSEKRATMFVDDNTLFLHLIDSDYQNNMSVVKILEVNEEEMSLIHRLELAEDPATIGVLTEDLYYYMDWDSKARVYDLLSDEDKEVELLEDESYVYNDSVMMELTS